MSALEVKNYACLGAGYGNKECIINVGLSYVVRGVGIIDTLKQKYPNALLLMDLKISNDDYLNAKIAYDVEVDLVSVLGDARNEVIKNVMEIACANNKNVLVDMRDVHNLQERVEDMELLGVDYILVPKGATLDTSIRVCEYVDSLDQFYKMQSIAHEMTI